MKQVPIIALTFAFSLPMVGCAANPVEPSGVTFVKSAISDRVNTMMAQGLREYSSLPSLYPESTESWVDQNAYNLYRGFLDRRAQRLLGECSSALQTTALNGYEVVKFHQKETIADESGTYTVYCWEPAFLAASYEDISLSDGVYFDRGGRLCGYERFTYFVVKDEAGDFPTYRFLNADLLNGTGEGTTNELVLQRIKQAFEPTVQGTGRKMRLAITRTTTRFPLAPMSLWPRCFSPAIAPLKTSRFWVFRLFPRKALCCTPLMICLIAVSLSLIVRCC